MSRRIISTVALAVLAAGPITTSASAHATLTASNPQANGSITTSPTELRLSFSESVVPKFSGVELKDELGKTVATGTASVDPKDKKQLVIPVSAPLPAGRYTVNWHAVSEDTHRLTGEYSFKVAPCMRQVKH